MKKANGFTKHIILYAKGWYGKSGRGVLVDLKDLLMHYASLVHCSDSLLWEALCRAVVEYLPEFNHQRQYEYLLDMLGNKWLGFNKQFTRKPEEIIVGMLSSTEGNVIDITDLMDGKWWRVNSET